MTTVTPVPRSRGSLSGLILILLGAWAGLAPFVGPYLFGLTSDISWKVTDGRIYLSALPGGVALFCGLLITASSSRGFGGLTALVAALAGGWLIVGDQVINLLPASVAASINKGGIIVVTGSTTRVDLLGMSTFAGVGALIVFFAAIALGRFSVVAYKDVLRYGTNLTAASGTTGGGPLTFDPFASSGAGAGAALFTQPQPQFYPGQQEYPSQYPADPPGSSPTITTPFPGDQEPPRSLAMRRIAATLAAVPAISLGLVVPASAIPLSSPQITSCGVWRWPVKTGSDADRFKVDKTAIATTISHLRSLKAPSSFAGFQDHRFRGAERHTWQLYRVRLTAYRIEADSDIHLVIRNAAGKTMIAEIPSPRCVSSKSLWRSQIVAARKTFMARDHATTSWKHVRQRITLRGLGFFDEIHDVTGQAPNGIELHPVTRVRF